LDRRGDLELRANRNARDISPELPERKAAYRPLPGEKSRTAKPLWQDNKYRPEGFFN
jgi:hypothetical protein